MAFSVPPSGNSGGLPTQLMTEEEIRQYFVRNGGVVKNTDIVNYFRPYLSNPTMKDEARIIFKTYVNKLANVKAENGEKFLVLKRQYFPPIDGNGNSNTTGLPPINNSYTTSQYPQSVYGRTKYSSPPASGAPGYSQQLQVPPPQNYNSGTSNQPHYAPQMNPYPGGGGGYPPPSTNNNLRRQNSQSQIYGSHFSLNSNYADPYSSSQQYYHQQMSSGGGLGHGHGGSTFSLASQYTTASSAGVPPYHHQQQASQMLPHYQQQVPMQNTQQLQHQQQHHVQPQLQRSLSQTQQSYAMHHQPVSQQMQQYSQQPLLPKNNFNYNSSKAQQGEFGLPPEYGLPPPVPLANISGSVQNYQARPTHRHISPQHSGSTSSLHRGAPQLPPPYREPPPPVATFGSPTSGPPPVKSNNLHHQHMRRSSLSSSSMSGVSNVRFNRSPSVPGPEAQLISGSTQNINSARYPEANHGPVNNAFQYQRSVSVSGLPGAVQGIPASVQQPEQHQQIYLHTTGSDFPLNQLNSGAPPPPVPPRVKRGVERSPSAVSGTASSGHKTTQQSSNAAGFGGNRRINRNNMEALTNGSSNSATSRVNGGVENDHEKENINLVNGTNGNSEDSSCGSSDGPNDNNNMHNGDSEPEQKISVKERLQKFNRIASESELAASKMPYNRNKKEIASKHESVDFDTASLSSYGYGYGFSHTQLEPRAKEWMLKSAQCDYHTLNKMAQENPGLVRRRDMNYTCLHWAAKKGHVELVKLLAGTFQCDVNAKSNGGYTPLHMAAQFSRQEVYDLLVKAYNADVNIRDHSGKKPMQYLVRQDTAVSMDTFKKIKEKRRSTEMQRDRDSSFLRIGSLNVKVKSTREAFGYLLGKSSSSSGIERMLHKNWGSADNLPESEVAGEKDKQMMPPPNSLPNINATKKKKTRRANEGSPPIKENSSDSDSACGFGSDWHSP